MDFVFVIVLGFNSLPFGGVVRLKVRVPLPFVPDFASNGDESTTCDGVTGILLGVLLGFTGAVMVLGFDIGSSLPIEGVIASIIALVAITASTIWQKRISNNIPLSVNNMYQAIGAVLFHLVIIIFIFKEPFLRINTQFLLAMSHQVFLVSLGAFSILMYLIKNNSASKTVSLFFLIPVVTALMAWMFLDEELMKIDIIGFIIASTGVFISTRKWLI